MTTSPEAEIQKTLDFLLAEDRVGELRAIGVSDQRYRKPHVVAGYFDADHRVDMVRAALEQSAKAQGVYVVMNALVPALLARSANRVQPNISTTSDADIEQRNWILVDVDAGQPSGVSSSDTEHEAAIQVARKMYSALRAEGVPDMGIADSGNGAHLLIPVDLPRQDDGLVKRVLETWADRFNESPVKVDTSVSNPARITKLIGTWARKGDGLPDRPHRLSRWLYLPDEVVHVELDIVQTWPNVEAQPAQSRSGQYGKFDLADWIQARNVPIRSGPVPWSGGGPGARKWVMEVCIRGHRDDAAFIGQFENGAITAGCRHTSCSDWKWAELRAHYEPEPTSRGEYSQIGNVTSQSADSEDSASDKVTITTLADVEPEFVSFLWPGRFPIGKLSLIAGDPGLGKTYLTLDCAARVSLGSQWPDGGAVEQGDVFILTAEDGIADTVRPRLDALGANVHRIHAMNMSIKRGDKEEPLTLLEHLPLIEAEIIRYEVRLFIVDPILGFMGQTTDTHKSSAIRPILAHLSAMAERTRCAVVGIMHLNKRSNEGNAFYRITASLDFTAAARSVLIVGQHPDNPDIRVFASAKSNLSINPKSLGFRFTSEGHFSWEKDPIDISAVDLLGASPNTADNDPSVIQEAADFLGEVLTNEGKPTAAKS